MTEDWLGKGAALLCGVAFAASTICTRKGLRDSNATTAAIVSLIFNATIFMLVVIAAGELYVRTWWSVLAFVVAGLFAPALARILSYISMARIGASVSAPIIASESLFAALIGVIIFHEQLGVITWVGILVVFCGLLILSRQDASLHGRGSVVQGNRVYFVIALAAAVCYGVSINLRAEGLALDNRPSVGAAFSSLSSVALLPALYTVARKTDPGLAFRLTRYSGLWFMCAAVFVTLAWHFQFLALSMTSAPVVSTLTSARTIFIVLFAYLFLRDTERVSFGMAAGAILIFLGVLMI